MDGHAALPKYVPALGPVATSAIENVVPALRGFRDADDALVAHRHGVADRQA